MFHNKFYLNFLFKISNRKAIFLLVEFRLIFSLIIQCQFDEIFRLLIVALYKFQNFIAVQPFHFKYKIPTTTQQKCISPILQFVNDCHFQTVDFCRQQNKKIVPFSREMLPFRYLSNIKWS